MARPPRIEYPGALYHLTSRGNAQQPIFESTPDYETFLAILALVVARYRWRCHTYCLLGNHYHLLLETLDANLALGMRQLNGSYAQAFNRRRGRVGHVFQGRYGAILVETERHLLQLSRYVVLNPIRAGLRRRPEEWRWSSYRAMIGAAPAPAFLTVDWLLGCFGVKPGAAARRYQRFVEEEVLESPWSELRSDIYLGSPQFVEQAVGRVRPNPEIPMAQRNPIRPQLADLLSAGDRAEIAVAHREYGYRLNEIAVHLNVHYATVGRRLRAWENGRPMLQRKT
jgi:REP element-mobilizing transposase RayT